MIAKSNTAAKSKPAKPAKTLSSKSPTIPMGSTLEFYNEDFGRTLFPLNTNKFLINNGESLVKDYINKCLDKDNNHYSFISQIRVYGAKPENHLRRTVKLDAISEYYIYDIIFRNKNLFRKPHIISRSHYGYRFQEGAPISPTSAYKAFKGAISEYTSEYEYSMSFDVASYFNNIYHHDLVSWFSELGASDADAEGLGQMLRQIKSGISVDCLPQGLYPTKMIGNDFIRFVDNYHGLRSKKIVRFMDDFYLFSDRAEDLDDDFQAIQRLLGDKNLSVNPLKTHKGNATLLKMENEIDEVKQKLLERRRILITQGYDESGNEILKEHLFKSPLSEKEMDYINTILENQTIEEEDAELILTIMRENSGKVEKRLPYILERFPHLTKSVYNFCASVKDKELLSETILSVLNPKRRLMEFQLFWISSILEDFLMQTKNTAELIDKLFNHTSATSISKAKILEIPDTRFGLPELRNDYLVSGQSDWLAWSSAVGSRGLKKISRNHRLKYFGNSSSMNHLVAEIVLNA